MHLSLLEDPDFRDFWAERHLCSVTTTRPDGTLHVVPMGIALDAAARTAWGITRGHSVKVRNIRAAPRGAARIAICQVAGRYWASLEGTVEVLDDPDYVAEAERRYAARYRQPQPNPSRVALRVHLTRALGNPPPGGSVEQ